jgi:putative ABC transport system permease protein
MVMKKLFLKQLRDMMQSKGQFIAIILVIAVGIAFYTGLATSHSSINNMVKAFYKDQNLADLWVYYGGIDDAGVAKINAINGVVRAEGVTRIDAVLTSGKGEFFVQSLPKGNNINKPSIISGSLPNGNTQCIIDKGYAEANNLNIGDSLNIIINNRTSSLTISGTYISPEYIYLVKNVEELIPDHKKFGALFVNQSLIEEICGKTAYKEVVIDAKEDADLKALQKAIEEQTNAYGYGYALGREYIASYAMLKSDIDQLKALAFIFPNIFFLVAAVIIFISMSRNVESQRNQIGIMKAIGERNVTILIHYLSFTVLSCISGSIIGSLAGVLLLPQGLYSSYNLVYTLPAIHPSGYATSVLTATVLSLLFGIAATIFSCIKTLKEVPAQAMRPKPPKKVKEIFLERNGKLWAKIPYNKKLILRNIFVNKKRAILSSFGIIGCVGLIIASLAFNDELNKILKDQYENIFRYDVSVTLNAPVFHKDALNFDDGNITGIYEQASIPLSYHNGNKDTTINLYALDEDNQAVSLFDTYGSRLSFPRNGVIVSKKYADKNKVKTGDFIDVKLIPPMQSSKTIRAQVKGIAVMYLSQDMYTTFNFLDSLNISAPVDTVYLTVKDAANIQNTVSGLKSDSRVKTAISKGEISEKVNSSMGVMNTFIAIMIFASAILALTVVFNISSINIYERRRDIATLKVLGNFNKEVNSLVFTENLFITAFGSIFGIGFGVLVFYILTQTMAPESMMMPIIIKPLSVIIAIGLGFMFTLLANQMLRRKIKKIDMVESLKSVE